MGTTETLLIKGTLDTLIMVGASLLIAYAIGLPLGVALVLWKKNGLRSSPTLYAVVSRLVNLARSIPFIIFLTILIPFTRLVVGTSIGIEGTIVPLSLAAAPFVGRLIEQSLEEVPRPLIQTLIASGASRMQIVWYGYLGEALPSIVRGVGISGIALIGYSAMAGATGGGGLGDLAIRYGYYNYRFDIMLYTVLILIVLVELFQAGIHWFSKRLDHQTKSSKRRIS
jgi:D-methionine transport system permease protein